MKRKLFLLVILILIISKIIWFLNFIANQVCDIDDLEYSLRKVDDFVPKSGEIYFFSSIKDVSHEAEIYFKTQFVLVPRIVIKKENKDIPKNSYVLILEENGIESIDLKTDSLFSCSDTLFSYNKKFNIILLKKK